MQQVGPGRWRSVRRHGVRVNTLPRTPRVPVSLRSDIPRPPRTEQLDARARRRLRTPGDIMMRAAALQLCMTLVNRPHRNVEWPAPDRARRRYHRARAGTPSLPSRRWSMASAIGVIYKSVLRKTWGSGQLSKPWRTRSLQRCINQSRNTPGARGRFQSPPIGWLYPMYEHR